MSRGEPPDAEVIAAFIFEQDDADGEESLKSMFESMGEGTMSSMGIRMVMEAWQAQMILPKKHPGGRPAAMKSRHLF